MPEQLRKCQVCGIVSKNCKICGSCGVTYYCGRECQLAARPKHAGLCKEVKMFRKRLDAHIAILAEEHDEGFVEKNVDVTLTPDGADYCVDVQGFCFKLVELGQAEGSVRAFEVAEQMHLELMRLMRRDKLGVRFLYPFELLSLGRVQDCYDFIAWWLTIDSDYNWDSAPDVKKGEWSYGRNRDMMGDILSGQLCVGYPDLVSSFHLVALLMIKLLVVKSLEGAKGKFYPKLGVPKNGRLDEQKALVEQYHKLLRQVNTTLVAALESQDVADVLMEKPLQPSAPGSVQEAVEVISVANYVWKKAGLRDKLEEILGI